MDDDTEAGESDHDRGAIRNRLEEGADRAVEEFDERLIDVLAWALDTETRARIYIFLRGNPGSTSDEIADGTGLYPSTVREALADLHDEGIVTRSKRAHEGAGNNPFEYGSIPPSELVGDLVNDVQDQLNTVINLDRYLENRDEEPTDPISITVSEPDETDSDRS